MYIYRLTSVHRSLHDIVCQSYTVPCTSSARTVTLGIVNIADIADIADIGTDIVDIATDIIDVVNIADIAD